MSDHHHHHDHGHDHGMHAHGTHSHGGHGHHHAPADFGRAFVVGISLNILIVVLEVVFGVLGHSVALFADAAHNLSDVLGLAMAFAASLLVRRAPSGRYTYGLRGTSILAALFNAVFLLVVTGGLGVAAFQRFFAPEPVASGLMMIVAGVALLVNGATAALFAAGHKGDINVRGAFLHMAADAALSFGVLLGGLVIRLTGWVWFDPAMTLAIGAFIVWGTWGLLRESLAMSLDAVPLGIDADAVRRFLAGLPGVDALHDLHIWPMSTSETALTAHLVMSDGHPGDTFLMNAANALRHHYGIGHATLQIETDGTTQCALAPAHVV